MSIRITDENIMKLSEVRSGAATAGHWLGTVLYKIDSHSCVVWTYTRSLEEPTLLETFQGDYYKVGELTEAVNRFYERAEGSKHG